MLLEITLRRPPADDLGYLLGKHPAKVQTFDLAFGRAHVYYPGVDAEVCTAAMLVDVDPIGLVRGHASDFALGQYVNDRPYVASSFLSVAIARVYRSAVAGLCPQRDPSEVLPLCARVAAVACRRGDELERLFGPLGYDVKVERDRIADEFPDWGEGRTAVLTLEGQVRLQDLLAHLYVLLPALDGDKHYWVGDDEVEKLLRRGEGWLAGHPEKAWIANRYLKRRRPLVNAALQRLGAEEDEDDDAEQRLEERVSLNDQRLGCVLAALRAADAHRVVDMGCGEGRLVRALLDDATFTEIVGVDVSMRTLQRAAERLQRFPERKRARARLLQGALTYRDKRVAGFDAVTLVEVIEHLDAPRLDAMRDVVFGFQAPHTVVVTTPNVEYNVRFEGMPAGRLRHPDHRFEWTRAEFEGWSREVAARHGYHVRFTPVGTVDATVGPPTQMATFEKGGAP